MKKRYMCNRCGAPANLDFEGQDPGFVKAILKCANRSCGGTLELAEKEGSGILTEENKVCSNCKHVDTDEEGEPCVSCGGFLLWEPK